MEMQKIKIWCNQNMSFLVGVGAIVFGTILAYIAREVVLNLVVFLGGLFLIYYGLVKLKLTKITNVIDQMLAKLRR